MSRPNASAPITFTIQTIAAQLVAAAAFILTWEQTSSISFSLILGSIVALSVVSLLKLSTPWRLLNTFLPPAIAWSLSAQPPSWIFLIPLVTLLVIYAPAFWTRVPYYPTSKSVYPLILAELPADRPFTFVDIGCGFGDLLVFLRRHRPNGVFYGVEIGILPYLVARARTLTGRNRGVVIFFQDLKRLDFGTFSFVYAFLSPAAMNTVWRKASAEMGDGSTFITNSFDVAVAPTYRIATKDERQATLYVHKMNATPNSKLRSRR